MRPYVDHSKRVLACKVYNDNDFFAKEDRLMLFKEIKVISMLHNQYCMRHY